MLFKTHLVVVAIGDGIGVDASLLHFEEHPDCQHRLPILPTQLHENPVAHLQTHTCEPWAPSTAGPQPHGLLLQLGVVLPRQVDLFFWCAFSVAHHRQFSEP